MESERFLLNKIRQHLKENYNLITEFNLGTGSNRLIPDAVIYRNEEPVALVEIKKNLNNQSYNFALKQFESYQKDLKVPFGIIFDGKQALFVKLPCNDTRMSNSSSLEEAFEKLYNFYEIDTPLSEKDRDILHNFIIEMLHNSLSGQRGKYRANSELPQLNDLTNAKATKSDSILLPQKYEDQLFRYLLGKFYRNNICRYTTLSSIIRIIESKKNSVCSIVCMNDKSECYYFDEYIHGKGSHVDFYQQSNNTIKELNKYFIMSCSDISSFDRLTMWRMYADDAKGVCLNLEVDSKLLKNDFYLAPISYGNNDGTHPELDFIVKLLSSDFNGKKIVLQRMSLWSHFFKPNDYADEKEIRLLYRGNDSSRYKWITTSENIICPVVEFCIENGNNEFPLKIASILLGPKCYEKETNAGQLRIRIEAQNIVGPTNSQIPVEISKIDNYR